MSSLQGLLSDSFSVSVGVGSKEWGVGMICITLPMQLELEELE